MSNNYSKIDQAIIILSFIYQKDNDKFQEIMSDISLNYNQKKQIIDQINTHSFYDTTLINETIETFCADMSVTEIVSHDAITTIKQLLDTEHVSTRSSTTTLSPLDHCDISALIPFLETNSPIIKGLICNSVSNDKFKDLLAQLPAKKISGYLESFHDISPVSQRYLMSFSQFVSSKINTKSSSNLLQEKLHKLVAVIERMGKKRYQQVCDTEPRFNLFKRVKPYCLESNDIGLFNENDQKYILDELQNKKILTPYLYSLDQSTRNKVITRLSTRQQAILKEEMSIYENTKNKEATVDQESIELQAITLMRILQKKGKISSEIKNMAHIDPMTLKINMVKAEYSETNSETNAGNGAAQ